ncbi:hypothetical protein BRARA_I03579 [Brassica rapa]|uniref:Uncharacterized protein n=1 Tax=Brassica campestris TaxID=3711 RepID=A0A397XZY7_BRACM|nr:hypothetical protein BRARA_I03579 [Brassica rapa]
MFDFFLALVFIFINLLDFLLYIYSTARHSAGYRFGTKTRKEYLIMKKTTKAFPLLLSLIHILLCLSSQVRVIEARIHNTGVRICARPPPPCGDESMGGDQVSGHKDKPCKPIPRPSPPKCS